MTDIVDHLREPAGDDVPVRICRLMDEAANEITRLRSALSAFLPLARAVLSEAPPEAKMFRAMSNDYGRPDVWIALDSMREVEFLQGAQHE